MSSELKFEFGLRWAELGRRLASDDPTEREAALSLLEQKDRQIEDYLNGLQDSSGLPSGWTFRNDTEFNIDVVNGSDSIEETIIANNTSTPRYFLITGEADIYTVSGNTSVVGDNVHLYCHMHGPASSVGAAGSSWRYPGTANGVNSAENEFHLVNTFGVEVNVTGEIQVRLNIGVPLSNNAGYRHRWSRISVIEVLGESSDFTALN